MKKFYTLLLVIITFSTYSQTVTTLLDSPNADVDDALALDSQGNLYGSTFYGGVVYKITPDGNSTTFVSGLAFANGLAVDSEDNVFVVEYGNGTINKYDSDGNVLQKFPVTSLYPSGLIKSYKSDNMVFTDVVYNSVSELAADGTIKVLHEGAPLNIPVGLAYGPKGDLYVGNYIGREIYRIPANGGEIEYVATVPAPDNFVPYLAFIAYAQGFLYGTVYGENKIYQISPRNVDDVEIYSGSTFGNTDGGISDATYAFPAGIIANKSGNTLYVSEFSGLGNIRKITNGNGNGLVNNEKNFSVKAYPNPASDFLTITSLSEKSKSSVFNIKLYNISNANLVVSHKNVKMNKDSEYTLLLSGLENGFYELIISNNDISKTKTILIKRE